MYGQMEGLGMGKGGVSIGGSSSSSGSAQREEEENNEGAWNYI